MRNMTGVAGMSLAASIALAAAVEPFASAQTSTGGNKLAAEALFDGVKRTNVKIWRDSFVDALLGLS